LTSSVATYESYQRSKRKLRWRNESHLPKAKFGNFFPASADALLQCNRLGECHRRLWTTCHNLRRSQYPPNKLNKSNSNTLEGISPAEFNNNKLRRWASAVLQPAREIAQ
ncbi:MAG: hypothetical protein ACTS6P_02040, partial [Candidatus Hodgkinia cicadicola]